MLDISLVTRKIVRVESALILLSVTAIAYGDYLVGPDISLGYLYLIPLSYSVLTHRLWTTMALVALCVALRQYLGPLQASPWAYFIRDWVLTGVFLSVVVALHRLGRDRREFFETAKQQRDELVREVELAAKVQQQLLSQHVPPRDGFDIVARTSPARVVGGDYYDFIPLGESRLSIVIADVAGKGLPAALLMPAVQIALRALTGKSTRAEEILSELNSVIYEATDPASYATLFYGELDVSSGLLTYSGAGHLPALLIRDRDGSVEWLSAGGTPIGLLPDGDYQTGRTRLESGDLLVLYTDGVVEAENREQEQFGEERLKSVVQANRSGTSEEIVQAITEAVNNFRAGAVQGDDLTVITVRQKPYQWI